MHLNLNLRARGFHRAAWRHPAAVPHAVTDVDSVTDLVRTCEDAASDAVFLADTPVHRDPPSAQPLEPFALLSAVAAGTSRTGPAEFLDTLLRTWAPGVSPQGHPVIVQAGASDRGRDLAGRYAEAVYTGSSTVADGVAFRSDVLGRVERAGRQPGSVRILPGLIPYVGRTEVRDHYDTTTLRGHLGLPVPQAVAA